MLSAPHPPVALRAKFAVGPRKNNEPVTPRVGEILESLIMHALLCVGYRFRFALDCEEGQDLVEYALVAASIALAAVASIRPIAGGLNGIFTSVSSALV